MNHQATCREWIAKNFPEATHTEKRLMIRGYFAGVHAQLIAASERAAEEQELQNEFAAFLQDEQQEIHHD